MSAFNARRAQMEQPECESCGSDDIVTDTAQGYMVCRSCGVILRHNMISTSTEYRNFTDSDKPTGAAALLCLQACLSAHGLQHAFCLLTKRAAQCQQASTRAERRTYTFKPRP